MNSGTSAIETQTLLSADLPQQRYFRLNIGTNGDILPSRVGFYYLCHNLPGGANYREVIKTGVIYRPGINVKIPQFLAMRYEFTYLRVFATWDVADLAWVAETYSVI
jgi:hypothetical protein